MADGVGRFSNFQHGKIVWRSDLAAYPVHGSVLSQWSTSGFENGRFGYPTGDPSDDGGLKLRQEFQHGEIGGYAEPYPTLINLASIKQEQVDEIYDTLKNDYNSHGIGTIEGFIQSLRQAEESYAYTLSQVSSMGVDQNGQPADGILPRATIDTIPCTFIPPGNERTNRGDLFYSVAKRFKVVNHGHNGIFVSNGDPDPGNIVTVEAVGVEEGVQYRRGNDRAGVCRPVYLSVNTTDEIREKAASFAQSKVGRGYNESFLMTRIGPLDSESYNCSQLVWAAYKSASGGGLDIGEAYPLQPYEPGVYPIHILRSHNVRKFE